MIEVFRWQQKWRLRIVNETFEFKDLKQLEGYLKSILKEKEDFEPYGK